MLLIPYSPPKAALWEIVWLLRYQLTQHILDDWLHWIQQFSMTLLSAEFWLTLMGAKSNIGLHGKFIRSYFCYVPKHMRPKLFWVTKYPESKLRFHFNPPRAIQLQSVFRIIPCMAHISNMCSVLNWNSNSKAIKLKTYLKSDWKLVVVFNILATTTNYPQPENQYAKKYPFSAVATNSIKYSQKASFIDE